MRESAFSAFRILILFLLLFVSTTSSGAQSDSSAAFRNFVMQGDYSNANFYLENKLIVPQQVDTSQLFYDVFLEKYRKNIAQNHPRIDQLFEYLNALNPIDFNRVFRCVRDRDAQCLIVNSLMHGARPNSIAWFVERGLDLNKRVTGIHPATINLILRLGSHYSLEELNWIVSAGMVLGDEAYPIEELSNFRNSFIYYDELKLPDNYLSLADQNFLDMLVIVLSTRTDLSRSEESRRRAVLCDFIAYAAASFTPSFDYLLHVLKSVETFRGGNIGVQKKDGRRVYQVFPTSCVSLVQSMAVSHARLDTVISAFAADGDVGTANWLISIQRGQN